MTCPKLVMLEGATSTAPRAGDVGIVNPMLFPTAHYASVRYKMLIRLLVAVA